MGLASSQPIPCVQAVTVLCVSVSPCTEGFGADIRMLDQDPGGQELLLLLWCGEI